MNKKTNTKKTQSAQKKSFASSKPPKQNFGPFKDSVEKTENVEKDAQVDAKPPKKTIFQEVGQEISQVELGKNQKSEPKPIKETKMQKQRTENIMDENLENNQPNRKVTTNCSFCYSLCGSLFFVIVGIVLASTQINSISSVYSQTTCLNNSTQTCSAQVANTSNTTNSTNSSNPKPTNKICSPTIDKDCIKQKLYSKILLGIGCGLSFLPLLLCYPCIVNEFCKEKCKIDTLEEKGELIGNRGLDKAKQVLKSFQKGSGFILACSAVAQALYTAAALSVTKLLLSNVIALGVLAVSILGFMGFYFKIARKGRIKFEQK